MRLQMDRTATRVDGDTDERVALREQFERRHWIRLPKLIDGTLLEKVQRGIAAASFVEVRHMGVMPPSVDVCMEPNAMSAMLELFCNDPPMLRAVEALTGCAPLSRFNGLVYRLVPGEGHHHNWHNDLVHQRRVSLSINLEPAPYEGGILQIRRREEGTILDEIRNIGAGDAILFRVDAALQHRVTPVTRGVKTAFAGWFRSAEPLWEELRRGASATEGASALEPAALATPAGADHDYEGR